MPAWTSDELDTIGSAEELDLASVRRDGTLRRPVTMSVVRDGLYVRSVNGRWSYWSVDPKRPTRRTSARAVSRRKSA